MAHDFMDDDFLLGGECARSLFHNVAESSPIVDLHNHLSAPDIAGDRVYETLTDLWLADDHYKWKQMRLAGIDEHLITGGADPWDKFEAWALTVPRMIRNPLYTWTHLELRRVFGIDLVLGPATAREVWDEANRQLPRWSAQALLSHFDVEVVATTDDPGDDLVDHRRLLEEDAGHGLAMIPTFRPDAAHRLLEDPTAWNAWADRLELTTGIAVEDLDSLLAALTLAHRRGSELGGRASDHGLECLPDTERDPALADGALRRARRGSPASALESDAVVLEVVTLAARLAHSGESVLQLHLGAVRDVSARVLKHAGREGGGDVMGDERQAPGLIRFLGRLDRDGAVPRTVLYNLNPADNALFATMAGALSTPGIASVVQWGPPWWFNDHEAGMRSQLDDLSQIGQLAGFVGMLTDSRSILSMTRHELFRRVLCDAVGGDVDEGRIPPDLDWLATVVGDICVDNAVRFFGLRALRAR